MPPLCYFFGLGVGAEKYRQKGTSPFYGSVPWVISGPPKCTGPPRDPYIKFLRRLKKGTIQSRQAPVGEEMERRNITHDREIGSEMAYSFGFVVRKR